MRRVGVEPTSPPWQGGVLTTGPTALTILYKSKKKIFISSATTANMSAKRRHKYKNESEMTQCVVCGEPATRLNNARQPVCRQHTETTIDVACPTCGLPMEMRDGKYGYFWGCTGFPLCEKTLSIKQQLQQQSDTDT